MKGAAVWLAGGLLLAGVLVSRPLVREWTQGLPVGARGPVDVPVLTYAPSDTLQLFYQLWLFRDGLVGPAPFARDPYQFRVNGPRWNVPQTFPPLAVPFTLLAGGSAHAAYNALVLLSFPFAGLAAYALIRRLGGDVAGALGGGLAYALGPARLGPLFGGHPAGFAAALAPLALWGLDRAVVEGSLAGGLVGGAAILALATLEPHYTYLTAALLLPYAWVRWRAAGAPAPRLAPLAAFALLAASGAGWLFMLRQSFLVGSIAQAGRTLGEVRLFSPGPAALLEPDTYGGAAVLALALVGFLDPASRTTRAGRLLFGGVLAAGLILSLGPTVPGFPLYQALHRWVPLFALIRNPEKFRLLASLGAAVLAGHGVSALARRAGGRWAVPVAVGSLAALGLGTPSWHPVAVARFGDHPAYATLRAEASRVLYLPLWPGDSAWSSLYLYAVTRTRVPTVNGYSPLVPRPYVTEVYEPLASLNVGDLGAAEHARLRRLGVTHVVVDRAAFPPQVSAFPSAVTLSRLLATPALELRQRVDPLWVFRLTDRPATSGTRPGSPVGLFHEAERLPSETGVPAPDAAASGAAVAAARAPAHRAGFMVFGPYRPLPAGAYRVTFRVRGQGLVLDVAVEKGRRVLTERALPPSDHWVDATLDFELDRAHPVEHRVRWDGTGEAAVDWVAVTFADRPDPEWRFEVEALPHRLGEQPDPEASGGVAGYADPRESLRTDLVSGPARRFPPGRYRLVLRARVATRAAGPLLKLAVTEPGGRVLASRVVDGAELPAGAYREVALAFALDRATVLEFPVGYLGGTGVYLDTVAVVPG